MRRHAAAAVALGVTSIAATLGALADRVDARMMVMEEDLFVQPTFELQGAALGADRAPAADVPDHLAGSTIALHAGGAVVIDGDSGELIRVDGRGKVTGRLAIGAGAAQLVVDGDADTAYVTDRRGDRVVAVALDGKQLTQRAAWATPAEPWGLALSPDRATLLVTTIADRTLVALDPATGEARWQRALSREPRGVAIAPDGATALVAYLTTGTVERLALDGDHAGAHVSLTGGSAMNRGAGAAQPVTGFVAEGGAQRGFARGAFAARFIGNGLAVVGHHHATPVQVGEGGFRENRGSYGGGAEPPLEHRLAFLGAPEGATQPVVAARVIVHQPNAIGWEAATDTLVIAGYGSDDVLILDRASQASVALRGHVTIGAGCGPDGVAVAAGKAWVWCSLSRRVAQLALDGSQTVVLGPEATTSSRGKLAQRGLEIFRAGNDGRVSTRGAMACASCHPDGRADGLSWRIEGHTLQTPVLSGRVAGTHPYKWDGGDKDLTTSLTSTMRRLGGVGLDAGDVAALAAYLEALPAPRAPTRERAQIARGKKLFAGALGCDGCHGGARLTDGDRHELASDLKEVDTPSLIGLAASAPYYHDGSAATLEALLRDTGLVHGMADVQELTDGQIADLVAYLETL